MNIQLILVPYDTARRGWRSGAGPDHLLRAGLSTHLQSQGHVVAEVQVIEDDPTCQPDEIRTAFELARRLATAVRSARAAGRFPLVLSGNCNSAVGTSVVSPRRVEQRSGSTPTAIATRRIAPPQGFSMGWGSP